MSAATIVKIIFLIIATILAIVSVIIGRIVIGGKRNQKNGDAYSIRKVMRIRMICFLIMLVLLFICVVI